MLVGDPTATSQTRGIIGGSSERRSYQPISTGLFRHQPRIRITLLHFRRVPPSFTKSGRTRGLHHPGELDLCRRGERRSSVIYFPLFDNSQLPGGNWMGGEAIIQLQAGPTWIGQPPDYWAPTN